MLKVSVLPLECVKQLLTRETKILVFLFPRRQVELYLCKRAKDLILWHSADCLLAVLWWTECAVHIE